MPAIIKNRLTKITRENRFIGQTRGVCIIYFAGDLSSYESTKITDKQYKGI